MQSDETDIPELRMKIEEMGKWAVSQKFPSASDKLNGIRPIARKAKIPYNTLYSCFALNRISIKNQAALADLFQFSLDWPEWRGSAVEFMKKFTAHKSTIRPLVVEAKSTKSHLDRQLADFAFSVAGSFEADKERGSIRLVVSLSFDHRGWPVFRDLTVGLTEVDLQIESECEGSRFDPVAIECSSAEEGNFVSRVNGTGMGYAYWTIRANDTNPGAFLHGNRRRNDGDDCRCLGLSKGARIQARLTARRVDCFGTISGKSISTKSTLQKRFIEHVTKLAVQGGAVRSDILLAEQTLTVITPP